MRFFDFFIQFGGFRSLTTGQHAADRIGHSGNPPRVTRLSITCDREETGPVRQRAHASLTRAGMHILRTEVSPRPGRGQVMVCFTLRFVPPLGHAFMDSVQTIKTDPAIRDLKFGRTLPPTLAVAH